MTTVNIALIGNPNTGKTSVFNNLTGLRQRVGNYPGITIDKSSGKFKHEGKVYEVFDLPGTYSLYPSSSDEEIAFELLFDEGNRSYPHVVIVVVDGTNLKRGLPLLEQVLELKIPAVLVINMIDEAEKQGITVHADLLEETYKVPVVLNNARKDHGSAAIKKALEKASVYEEDLFVVPAEFSTTVEQVKKELGTKSTYIAWKYLARNEAQHLNKGHREKIMAIQKENKIVPKRLQVTELLQRNKRIDELLKTAVTIQPTTAKNFSQKLDQITMHPVWGYVIFAFVLFILFQSIFLIAQWPMEWIEMLFAHLSKWTSAILPEGPLNGLVTDGIIAGIGGVAVFIPQITLLFLGLLILEESGYMSRVVFLMDRWMKPFGLNGKSVVPLMSGAACAIPAVMSARTIEHPKERLITILTTPFITCSARLPVYTLIIALIIPDSGYSIISVKGLVLLVMYFLGIVAALVVSLLLKFLIKNKFKSYLVMEIPPYRMPVWKNVGVNLWIKVRKFLFGAGKIILAISIILWVLASFGPGDKFKNAEAIVQQKYPGNEISTEQMQTEIKSFKLQHSFLGIMGNAIEPALRPLGYDWKIGVGIIASFAAREVFVPTMATIYSISNADDDAGLTQKMRSEIDPRTGKPVYNLASGISLLMFYAFAMMCMSTVAAVKNETKSWKWTLVQLAFMTGMAYLCALIAYQVMK